MVSYETPVIFITPINDKTTHPRGSDGISNWWVIFLSLLSLFEKMSINMN